MRPISLFLYIITLFNFLILGSYQIWYINYNESTIEEVNSYINNNLSMNLQKNNITTIHLGSSINPYYKNLPKKQYFFYHCLENNCKTTYYFQENIELTAYQENFNIPREKKKAEKPILHINKKINIFLKEKCLNDTNLFVCNDNKAFYPIEMKNIEIVLHNNQWHVLFKNAKEAKEKLGIEKIKLYLKHIVETTIIQKDFVDKKLSDQKNHSTIADI